MQVDSLKLNILFMRCILHVLSIIIYETGCNNIMRESFPQCDYIEKQFTKIRPTEMLNDLHRKKTGMPKNGRDEK